MTSGIVQRERGDRAKALSGGTVFSRSDAGCDSVGPFLLGTAVGGLAGAVAGTLLSDRTRRLLLALIRVAGRRLTDAERDQLRFELLLQ